MAEKFTVGSVIDGKVTGIQPYGAFVALDEETQGLVHISEVTHGFVKDINEHLKVGQEVPVKVISVDEKSGKLGLSIRATQPEPEVKEEPKKKRPQAAAAAQPVENAAPQGFNTLREKLEEWVEQSNRQDLIKK
ncbi:S1 domain-containing post-transcriptional regulator GSP13 [Priestia endophytica]|jgi:general stress protein 13|uniref:RNA-binding protein S1 n=2 Tax=Priestia endophytica TaxID=135735 RepID=A0AAX1Q6C9_9BACI|nr:S1 domain-containing post-transcriptional regulator GSP13 [Priestia endophytica]KAB2492229.1 general stress protein 13 [Priestia endophytica]KYG28315.1 RNA-binding protein S1 [Priestia endophytica]MBG9810529.1 general stress protein [Priestia endophytica]MCY8231594.1 S1 domain-containing post-transcriptional regulator GSP13 [Priestia endophytica]MED4071153.1 S1 domain-containing post-transcriptional regulator GSP13 [Priestia endophytica]